MKNIGSYLLLFLALGVWSSCSAPAPPRVLIYSRTNGYRHLSIEPGKDALVKLCYENGILADTTEDPRYLNERNLKRYAAVVFLNTNGDVLGPAQEADFERYIQAGGGFMGVHSASGTEYDWRWYGGLVGGYFKDHPAIQEVDMKQENCDDPALGRCDCQTWKWKEELYNFRNYEPDLKVLLTIDEGKYTGGSSPAGANPAAHPLAWYHSYDGGRAFYTALGHIPESYTDPQFLKHLLRGLKYAVGGNKPLHYDRCRTQRLPDQTRFVKTVVASDLSEPMEIAGLPDGKVLLIERHGRLKMFNPNTGLMNVVAKLPVYSEMGDGLMGLAIDPHWEENHWIYLYYSSLRDSMNQLSRFVFQGDSLDFSSENVFFTIPVGHKDCFHAAGSLTFDAEGCLYLSTGDNTSPFASDGYAPLDERPGRKSFDAQRGAANSNDLRGKVIRIKPLPDGSYICPKGNLFTDRDLHITNNEQRTTINEQQSTNNEQQSTNNNQPTTNNEKTRPEIYIMGCRNPFRISYDSRRKYLFWGEVGPDAGKADTVRGALGHDEINRAARAGNYGWPYFVADNQAYRDYDFEAQKPGPYFDPAHPVNNSPNNTGIRELPPAQPAFIWYPYGKNREFPVAGTGGRNAMAGPVFYADQYPADTRFPDYYDGKLIIYDWMRNWMMAVTLDSLGNFKHLEPFGDSVKLSRPMDMFFDLNGSLWLIEYGTRWYSSNEDARLSHIDFVRGNRPPLARMEADKTALAEGDTISFDFSGSKDFDGGPLRYEIDFGDGTTFSSTVKDDRDSREPILRHKSVRDTGVSRKTFHAYAKPGKYQARLKVTDSAGLSAVQSILLTIGNEAPLVQWNLGDRNRSFYKPGDTLHYDIAVRDREDGKLYDGIAFADVETSIDFFENGINPATFGKNPNKPLAPEKFAEGKRLVEQSDCKTCHAVDKQINGPSFEAVAARYRLNRDNAFPSIYRKIIYGGTGNWGTSIMIPHPQIREEDAIQMALWILSLGDPPKVEQHLPLSGEYALKAEKDGKAAPNGAFVFRAKYRDRGAQGQEPLETSALLFLRPARMQAEKCDDRSLGVGNYKPFNNDTVVLNELKHNAWVVFRQVDLRSLKKLVLRIGYGDKKFPYAGGTLEIHSGSLHGEIIGEMRFESKNGEKMVFEERELVLKKTTSAEKNPPFPDLYFVFKNPQNQGQGVVGIDWIVFD